MSTRTVDVCDSCDEQSEDLKTCVECKQEFCPECQEEHIEECHFDFSTYYDEHQEEFWK